MSDCFLATGLAFFTLLNHSAASAPEAHQIDTQRELFVDDFLIASLERTELRLHEPSREGIALKFDRPWEGVFSGYITVLKDGDQYRMYYRGRPEVGKDGSTDEVTCYAESEDGITWTKPNLGLFEVMGTKANNVILAHQPPFSHNFSPLIDSRPGIPLSERYKALAGIHSSGLVAFGSPDGIRWRKLREEPVMTSVAFAFDSQNVAFWSEHEQCYVCYFRTWKEVAGTNYRWVSRCTSDDFLNWSESVEMDYGDTPPEQLYTNATEPYFRAPHIYIALPKRFFPGKVTLPKAIAAKLVDEPSYRASSSDSVFMSTRGGSHYDRTFMEAFIRPGPSPQDWIARDNAPALGVVPANRREMFVYRLSHYAQPTSHLARYSLRLDGFVSVHAPYRGGEMITKMLVFEGSVLELNFATSAAGEIRVEIQDSAGQPIPGYTLDECVPMIGDEISRTVVWSHGSETGSLVGKPVRLRFAMSDADLYSLRFVPE